MGGSEEIKKVPIQNLKDVINKYDIKIDFEDLIYEFKTSINGYIDYEELVELLLENNEEEMEEFDELESESDDEYDSFLINDGDDIFSSEIKNNHQVKEKSENIEKDSQYENFLNTKENEINIEEIENIKKIKDFENEISKININKQEIKNQIKLLEKYLIEEEGKIQNIKSEIKKINIKPFSITLTKINEIETPLPNKIIKLIEYIETKIKEDDQIDVFGSIEKKYLIKNLINLVNDSMNEIDYSKYELNYLMEVFKEYLSHIKSEIYMEYNGGLSNDEMKEFIKNRELNLKEFYSRVFVFLKNMICETKYDIDYYLDNFYHYFTNNLKFFKYILINSDIFDGYQIEEGVYINLLYNKNLKNKKILDLKNDDNEIMGLEKNVIKRYYTINVFNNTNYFYIISKMNEKDNSDNFEIVKNEISYSNIYKLISFLINKNQFDFTYSFLLIYRSFMKESELLDILILYFNTLPSYFILGDEYSINDDIYNFEKFEDFYNNELLPLREKIYNILLIWINNFYYDFRDDDSLRKTLTKFISQMEKFMKDNALNLFKELKKKRRRNTFTQQQITELLEVCKNESNINTTSKSKENEKLKHKLSLKRNSIFISNITSIHNCSFTLFRSSDIAIQLTLICFSIFKNCRAKEFLNLNWTRANKRKLSPNVVTMIERSNNIGSWVIQEILKNENVKERMEHLKLFIKIANQCLILNNYNTIVEIMSGIESNAIHRLKKTWSILPKETTKIFENLSKIVSNKKNFKEMRSKVDSINKDTPAIPYIGIYLSDMVFIEDGNKDYVSNDLINYKKRMLQAGVIRKIENFQKNHYFFNDIPELKKRLLEIEYVDKDKLYELSLKIEPKH
jgi:hypothetical protein